ncbi:MAG: hypothetical protein ACRELY_24530, partial [Polyangiaceae bacterium]
MTGTPVCNATATAVTGSQQETLKRVELVDGANRDAGVYACVYEGPASVGSYSVTISAPDYATETTSLEVKEIGSAAQGCTGLQGETASVALVPLDGGVID